MLVRMLPMLAVAAMRADFELHEVVAVVEVRLDTTLASALDDFFLLDGRFPAAAASALVSLRAAAAVLRLGDGDLDLSSFLFLPDGGRTGGGDVAAPSLARLRCALDAIEDISDDLRLFG